jgi:hypothetical protein
MIRAVKQFFRSPRVIVGEIMALGLVCIIGAVWPQRHVFQGAGFVALALLAATSLGVVVLEQIRGRRAGSLLFHAGLLLIIIAGVLRALFATEAVVDLVEGETLLPVATAWSGQWPGWLAKPLQLDRAVTFETIKGSRYSNGDLYDLRARFSVGELAVNRQLDIGGHRLYLGQEFGPTALLEWSSRKPEAVLLAENGRGSFEGASTGPHRLRAHLRANAARPTSIEVRVMRGSALLAAGELRADETLPLPDGVSLALRGMPMWVRLHGSRDPALWVAGLGFVLVLVGCVLLFVWRPLSSVRSASTPAFRPDKAKGLIGNIATSVFILFLAGCGRSNFAEARQLVERYNTIVSEAYRRGDPKLVDSVVGPEEGKKILGLIGVRSDLGLTMDSQMIALEITGVVKTGDEMRIQTKEEWKYHDLKIGTGEQVGEASHDAYEMLYVLKTVDGQWLVEKISFVAQPKVGRKQGTWVVRREELAKWEAQP